MSLTGALAAGRRAAESRMLSRATVYRKTGAMTTDADGFEVPEWVVIYTDLPCRIASSTTSRTVTIADGVEVQVAQRVLHFPHDTTDLRDGDLVDVTGEASGVYRIVEADAADQQTARRVPVVATERPEEWS